MSYTKITLRYAAAFFDLAQEKGVVEKASEDMALLGKVCTSNHDFVRMLQNPVIHADKKKKVIVQIFGESQFVKFIQKLGWQNKKGKNKSHSKSL